eukprot:4448838-Amphidinium_carterae.1
MGPLQLFFLRDGLVGTSSLCAWPSRTVGMLRLPSRDVSLPRSRSSHSAGMLTEKCSRYIPLAGPQKWTNAETMPKHPFWEGLCPKPFEQTQVLAQRSWTFKPSLALVERLTKVLQAPHGADARACKTKTKKSYSASKLVFATIQR